MLACALPLRVAEAIEQWGVFEIALSGPTNGNPFVDVELAARFTQGTNAVSVPGFYDGDGVYRVRFSPETQGRWRYETKSNRRALSRKRGEFMVGAPLPRNHGPVRVTNMFHFAYADGTPYKQLGTTCYHWVNQTPAVQEQTLQTLAQSPFNKVRFIVLNKRYPGKTNESQYPFESKGTNFDTGLFNPKYFQHFEQRIFDLQRLGIEADLILFHPYDQGGTGFDRMTSAEDDCYLRYVVARFAVRGSRRIATSGGRWRMNMISSNTRRKRIGNALGRPSRAPIHFIGSRSKPASPPIPRRTPSTWTPFCVSVKVTNGTPF